MAGSGRYTVILDACVLFSRLQRDILLSLADADLYTARWSADIEREWHSALTARYPDAGQKLNKLAEQMRLTVPDCLVEGYQHLIPSLELPDANDRHVLAAAICGNADAIVTHNTRDFPRHILNDFDIELQTPDQFVLNQILLCPARSISVIKSMRQRWTNPAVSACAMITLFEQRALPQTAAHLRDVLDLI